MSGKTKRPLIISLLALGGTLIYSAGCMVAIVAVPTAFYAGGIHGVKAIQQTIKSI